MKTLLKLLGLLLGGVTFIVICRDTFGGYYDPAIFGVTKQSPKKVHDD